MQRTEFPLFLQTTIAIFGFLLFITVASSLTAPKSNLSNSLGTTMQVAKNLKVSY